MAPSDRRQRLAWLIAGRAIVSTLLLGSGLLFQINSPGAVPVRPFFTLISVTYGLTVVYAFALRVSDRLPWLADVQLAVDACVITAFIAVSGGVSSYFSLLYALPIIAAATLLRRRGALTVGLLSALLYGLLVVAQYRGSIPGLEGWLAAGALLPPPRVALYTVAINIFAFLAVAALAGSLAENLRLTGARLERASREIEDLQAFNQDIIDSLTSGLLTTDVAGKVLSFNQAAGQIAGLSSAEMIDRHVGDVLQLPDEVRRALAADLDGERSQRAEFFYHRPDGRRIEIGMAAAHLMAPGKAGFLITFQDVTDVKRLERDARVKQRLAAVGEMAAGIAHEIRNPLASIGGSIQVLREELTLDSEQAQLMDIVLRESKRLNDTIRGFLAYARPQPGSAQRIDLAKAVADTARLLANSPEIQQDQRVEADVPAAPVWFDADEGQIRQVLWNLATNGLRAMPGGGRLRLAVRAGERSGGPVLEVEDEGVGIPQEELDGIFQPFHGTFARGSGLGLAIVHRIVSDYGGEIEVSSAVGKGTMVRVRWGKAASGQWPAVGSRQ